MPLNITSASGKGAFLGMGEWGSDDLVRDPSTLVLPGASAAVNDWFWGGGPPDPIVIPWTWLTMPLGLRPDDPINTAAVTRANQAASNASNSTSQTTYGVFSAATTLNTISPDDAQNFANFLVAYYANPLMRCPKVTLSLVHRTDEERWRILGREIGDRFVLGPATVQDAPGHTTVLPVPAGLPLAARSLVIEGIRHESSVTDRIVEWTTAPLLGVSPYVQDGFNRVVSNDLGTADFGGAWIVSGGSAADYNVAGGVGTIALPDTSQRMAEIGSTATTDQDNIIYFTAPAVATGDSYNVHLWARRVDANNYYRLEAILRTTGAVDFDTTRVFGGSLTSLGSGSGVAAYAAGQTIGMRFQVAGSVLRGKVWNASTSLQPVAWAVTATDASIPAGKQGLRAVRNPANTNVGLVIAIDNFASYAGGNPQNVEGPWFRLGSSFLDGTDALPF